MRKLKSLESFYTKDRDMTTYIVESPIAAPRDGFLYMCLLGDVEIDGVVRRPVGIEWSVPATPVFVGEKIGLLVPGA